MAFDLTILTIIGFVIEIFLIKFGASVFIGAPFMGITLLIVFLAVARWNLWGLITAPIMAGAVWVGGIMVDIPYLKAVYDWRVYVSLVTGLMCVGLNVILFKKFGTKRVFSDSWITVLVVFITYVVVCGVQTLVYSLITYPDAENMIYYFNSKNYDLRYYGAMGIVYNLLGLVVAIVGSLIFRSQGVLCNAKQKLLDDKKNAELEREFDKFKIEESACDEEVVGEESKQEEVADVNLQEK